jgi:pyruvate ferredoxin oxidoreductase beta subunit
LAGEVELGLIFGIHENSVWARDLRFWILILHCFNPAFGIQHLVCLKGTRFKGVCLTMISRYPVFIPKLLPRDEYFVSGRRSCKGCGKALAVRMICKMLGKDVVSATHAKGSPSLSPYNQAGVGFSWDELTSGDLATSLVDRLIFENERAQKGRGVGKSIKKAVIGIDRRIFSKDPLALTGILKEHKEVIYICYDSEMYMDEFIRRSLPSLGAHGEGHPVEKDEIREFVRNKAIPPLVGESDLAYVATSCPSSPLDLMEKIKKGLKVSGTAFLSVLTPCPTTWLFKPDLTARLGLLAVNTGFYPLFEVEAGKLKVTKRVSPLHHLIEYFKAQQRYVTFPPELITLIQEVVKEEYERLLSTH